MTLAVRLLDVLLPEGGYLVCLAEMYFYESEDEEHRFGEHKAADG